MRKKILVVDDDRSLLTFLSFSLEECGHEILTAEDGISALNILTTFEPDVILVDLILPNIDGENLCRVIRTMNHLSEAYLVVMSSAIDELNIDFSAIGADACIAKGSLPEMAKHVLEAISEADLPRDTTEIVIRGNEHRSPRRTTRELIHQQRHLESILEAIDIGILEVFLGRRRYANKDIATLIGRPKAEILNAYPPDLFIGDTCDHIENLLNAETGSIPGRLHAHPLEHGRRRFTITCRRLDSEASSLLIFRDITAETSNPP